jgi:transposase
MSKEVGMSRKVRSKGGSPARTQGARRATGESAGGGALAPGQRWSAGRKRDVVLRILRGESLDALSRELGVEIYRLEEWRDKALAGLDSGLKDRQDDPLSHELDSAKRHIGELSMEIELLRERARAAEGRFPLATRRSRR